MEAGITHAQGLFKCYVMQWWGGGCPLSLKKRCEGVRFNVISVTRGSNSQEKGVT